MGHFYENARLGSHVDQALCGKRGLVKPAKSLRLAATAVAKCARRGYPYYCHWQRIFPAKRHEVWTFIVTRRGFI